MVEYCSGCSGQGCSSGYSVNPAGSYNELNKSYGEQSYEVNLVRYDVM